MRKGILVPLCIGLLSIGSVAFGYTPSASLESKLETVVVKIESIIVSKGGNYRERFLSAISAYQLKYAGDERATYILEYLELKLSVDTEITTISGDYTGEYTISDSTYGTEVSVTINNDIRTIKANALANHPTGEFPRSGNPNTISAQDKTYSLDYTPKYVGNASWARESGVAYNGVKFELETAERVECESGEVYKIEAIQDMVNLGLDANKAHVQPTGEYHYHGVTDNLVADLKGDDVVHVGYANDGFPLYYSKEKTYTPSYQMKDEKRSGTSCTYRSKDVVVDGTSTDGSYVSDWEYVEGKGNLDSCNGAYINGEYVYFITEAYPYGPRCLNGEYTQSGPGGGQGGERRGPPPRR